MALATGTILWVGCAYLKDGATSRIEILKQDGETVLINKTRIADSVREIEVRNSSENELTFIRNGSGESETIRSKLNNDVFRDAIMWPYLFVDVGLGSHRRIIDGQRYKVIETGPQTQDDC